MAADWFPMTLWLTRRREVVSIASAIGQHPRYVVGLLCDLWSWLSGECSDGFVPGLTLAQVSTAIGAEGFAEAVAAAGWLAQEPGGVRVINWERWLSNSAKRRAQNAKYQADGRTRQQSVSKPVSKPVSKVSASRADKLLTTEQNRDSTEEKNPPSPPSGGSPEPAAGAADPPQKPKRTRTKTPRDHVFDALAEVTGSDPAVSGSHVAKLAGKLLEADPPYTPDDVRRFADPAFVAAALPWLSGVVTLGIIEKHIGLVRRPVTPGAAHGRAAGPARPGRVEARPGQFDHLDAGTVPPEFFAPPDPPGGPGG